MKRVLKGPVETRMAVAVIIAVVVVYMIVINS